MWEKTNASAATAEPREFARNMIGRVSRTFAIGIKVLPDDLGRAVLVGYLLCRIADTVEDDGTATAARRQELLARFLDGFDSPERATSFPAEAADVNGADDYLELLRGNKLVFDLLHQLPPRSIAIVERWVREMVRGMSEFVGAYPNGIRIQTMDEYKRYCYFVAGTVGHLLTELWQAHSPFVDRRRYETMLAHCEAFGEALQTVNILKDIAWDIEHENSAYVPEQLLQAVGSSQATMLQGDRVRQNREALATLVALAKDDLRRSLQYFAAIPRRAVKIRLFCLLPILFAVATLREIERSTAMLESGGGVKITRPEVRALIFAGTCSAFSNKATDWLVRKTSQSQFRLGPVGS